MTTRPGRNCLEYVEECWGEVRSELFTGKDFGNPLLPGDQQRSTSAKSPHSARGVVHRISCKLSRHNSLRGLPPPG